jgi:hypothetical protein
VFDSIQCCCLCRLGRGSFIAINVGFAGKKANYVMWHLNVANQVITRGEENNVNGKQRRRLLLNGSLRSNFSSQIILNIKNKCWI